MGRRGGGGSRSGGVSTLPISPYIPIKIGPNKHPACCFDLDGSRILDWRKEASRSGCSPPTISQPRKPIKWSNGVF